ncbi:protein tyrosine phosphatase, partial [Mitsuokella jalaludinii]|uniref:phosphatase domain-containing putative toxin n=1 Tax=Mitsuokella jalaludinii TaxID=187979 RepID=UPI00307C7257
MRVSKKMVASLALAALLGGAAPQVTWAAQGAAVQEKQDAAANPLLSREDPVKYAGFIWRIDSKDKDKLPRNFRTANSAYRKDVDPKKAGEGFEANPSRKGLAMLYASGSAEFSAKEFDKMVPVLKEQAKGPIYIVDLRQESHGLINGTAVSWYGERDWGNLGKSKRAALRDEKTRLKSVRGKDVTMAKLGKDKKPVAPVTVKAESVMQEEQLVKSRGLRYFRIAATEHVWPSAENIDDFIRFARKLPKDAWLHFHCQAGKGRTTAYMA